MTPKQLNFIGVIYNVDGNFCEIITLKNALRLPKDEEV